MTENSGQVPSDNPAADDDAEGHRFLSPSQHAHPNAADDDDVEGHRLAPPGQHAHPNATGDDDNPRRI